MLPWQPLTYEEWQRIKAATRHRRFLERFTQAQNEYKAWLEAREAVRRDEATDPHEQGAPALEVPP